VGAVKRALVVLGIDLHKERVPIVADNSGRQGGSEATAEEPLVHHNTHKESKEGASIWTELVLAYAVHKSLIFIRVPLTAAVTPKVVKVFREYMPLISRSI